MEFESPDVAKDFPGLFASGSMRRSDSDYSDEEKVSRIDLLGKKKDKKESKKDKGYKVFEGESSDDELNEARSPGKSKKLKTSFKFPGKDKKEKHNKVKDKDAKEKKEEKEKVCKKESKESKKENKDSKKDSKDGKKDSKDNDKVKVKKKKESRLLKIKDKKKKNSGQEVKEEKPIFGIPLHVAVERNKSHDGIDVPVIVRECIDYIEEHGLTCEGIYRISGLKSKLRQLKDQYNRGEKVYLYEHEPHIVASLLKQFLRDLPEPILTFELTPKFEEAAALKDGRKLVDILQKLLQELPSCNRLLLSWVVVHMLHVVSLEKRNKMNLQNVYIVLSPTMQISHNILQALFAHSDILFSGIELKKYVPPIDLDSSRLSLELPDSPTAISMELSKQENILNLLHAVLNTGVRDHQKEEQLWEIQRVVTQLKRKLRFLRQVQDTSSSTVSCELQNSKECSEITTVASPNAVIQHSPVTQTFESKTTTLTTENFASELKPSIPCENFPPNETCGDEKLSNLNTTSQIEPVIEQSNFIPSESKHDNSTIQSSPNNTEKEYVTAIMNSTLPDSTEDPGAVRKVSLPDRSEIFVSEMSKAIKPNPPFPAKEDLESLRLEERMLRIKSDELLLLGDELRKKIFSEKQEISRLRMEIQEYERFYKFKKYSFDSTENSSIESGDESSSSCGGDAEEDLPDILHDIIAENKETEARNNELLKKIQLERERIINAKVEMKLIMQKRMNNSNVPEEHLI